MGRMGRMGGMIFLYFKAFESIFFRIFAIDLKTIRSGCFEMQKTDIYCFFERKNEETIIYI